MILLNRWICVAYNVVFVLITFGLMSFFCLLWNSRFDEFLFVFELLYFFPNSEIDEKDDMHFFVGVDRGTVLSPKLKYLFIFRIFLIRTITYMASTYDTPFWMVCSIDDFIHRAKWSVSVCMRMCADINRYVVYRLKYGRWDKQFSSDHVHKTNVLSFISGFRTKLDQAFIGSSIFIIYSSLKHPCCLRWISQHALYLLFNSISIQWFSVQWRLMYFD